jgi:hypothetical protein
VKICGNIKLGMSNSKCSATIDAISLAYGETETQRFIAPMLMQKLTDSHDVFNDELGKLGNSKRRESKNM